MNVNYKDAVVDIETLDDKVGGVIFSIGVVPFDLGRAEVAPEGDCFYSLISVEDGVANGFGIGAGTMMWWMKEDKEPEAVDELFKAMRGERGVKVVLERLFDWMKWTLPKDVHVWGKGPSFDNAHVANACHQVGVELGWNVFKEQCVRSWERLAMDKGVKLRDEVKFEGVRHHAYWDARHEAEMICCARRRGLV